VGRGASSPGLNTHGNVLASCCSVFSATDAVMPNGEYATHAGMRQCREGGHLSIIYISAFHFSRNEGCDLVFRLQLIKTNHHSQLRHRPDAARGLAMRSTTPVCISPCRRFETGGSLGRRVKMSPRAPAQMGRREMEREGGKTGSRSERERWKSRGLRVRPAPRSGALAVGGYKRPRGRGSEWPHASACPVLFPTRPTPCKRALVLPFIGARRGSRCTMGV
jgi:hypothetical protein